MFSSVTHPGKKTKECLTKVILMWASRLSVANDRNRQVCRWGKAIDIGKWAPEDYFDLRSHDPFIISIYCPIRPKREVDILPYHGPPKDGIFHIEDWRWWNILGLLGNVPQN